MSDAAEMEERHGRVLAELSELGLALARDLQTRALAAEDARTAGELGVAFHRVARSARQTLALEARLKRERQRRDREARAEAAHMEETRRQRRKARVRLAVERTIWDEADSPEAERLLDELDDRLDEAALSDAFTDEDVEACIARLRSDLGLAAPPADGEVSSVATPPAGPSPRRSSA